MKTKTLIVDDHPVTRAGVRAILEDYEFIQVVGEAIDGRDAKRKVEELQPDLVIMDISMPNLSGTEATKEILKEHPDIKVIALSIHAGELFVKEMLDAGASGYLLKDDASEELVEAISKVIKDEMYLSSAVTRTALKTARGENSRTALKVHQSKLHRPHVMVDSVLRTNIIRELEDNILKPLSLVSAGPGYGKSVAVSQWLENTKYLNSWISLDEEHNDLRTFLMYIAEAVDKIFPDFMTGTSQLAEAPVMAQLDQIAQTMINDLCEIDRDYIIVLDDYQRISDSSIHQLINEWLRFPPPSVHLCIVSRRDPPLDLQTLRLTGRLTEIRMEELSFDDNEIEELFEVQKQIHLEPGDIRMMQEKTEGWVIALRMISMVLDDKAKVEKILSSLGNNIHSISEYMLREILQIQPEMIREQFIRTSILDRFCEDLVREINAEIIDKEENISVSDQDSMLLWTHRHNLFIIPLDSENKWYRYHHLFRDYLYQELCKRVSEKDRQKLHIRASEWFEQNGYIDDGLEHSIRAENYQRAAQIIERHARTTINADQWRVVANWIAKLPDTVIQERPELLLVQALKHFYLTELMAIPPLLDLIDKLLQNDSKTHKLSGEVATLRGTISYFLGDTPTALKELEFALDRISLDDVEFRSMLDIHYLLSLQMDGQLERSIRIATDWLETRTPLNALIETRLLLVLTFMHYLSGDPDNAENYIARQREEAITHNFNNAVAWCDYLKGFFYLQKGEFNTAIQLLQNAGERKYFHFARAAADGIGITALAYQLNRQEDEANAMLKLLDEFSKHTNPLFRPIVDSYKARLALIQGQEKIAFRWLKAFPEPFTDPNFLFWCEIPGVTRCRALITEGSADSLDEAQELLRKYVEQNVDQHNSIQLISILTLQAIALKKQKKKEQSLKILKRSLELSKPGEIIFPFLEAGQPMIKLLQQIEAKNEMQQFIDKIFSEADKKEKVADKISETKIKVDQREKLTSLTPSELKVLECLAEGLRNQEIAEKLFNSEQTIKKHIYHMFQKLNVKNRMSLLTKAKEEGILK